MSPEVARFSTMVPAASLPWYSKAAAVIGLLGAKTAFTMATAAALGLGGAAAVGIVDLPVPPVISEIIDNDADETATGSTAVPVSEHPRATSVASPSLPGDPTSDSTGANPGETPTIQLIAPALSDPRPEPTLETAPAETATPRIELSDGYHYEVRSDPSGPFPVPQRLAEDNDAESGRDAEPAPADEIDEVGPVDETIDADDGAETAGDTGDDSTADDTEAGDAAGDETPATDDRPANGPPADAPPGNPTPAPAPPAGAPAPDTGPGGDVGDDTGDTSDEGDTGDGTSDETGDGTSDETGDGTSDETGDGTSDETGDGTSDEGDTGDGTSDEGDTGDAGDTGDTEGGDGAEGSEGDPDGAKDDGTETQPDAEESGTGHPGGTDDEAHPGEVGLERACEALLINGAPVYEAGEECPLPIGYDSDNLLTSTDIEDPGGTEGQTESLPSDSSESTEPETS